VILALTPTTNPTSTIIHNSMCAIKAGIAIIFSPHPNSVKCSNETVRLLHDAAVRAGAPKNIISCVGNATMEATNELMRHENIAVIIATGGSAMVKAAYSAGKPALGVGPGNVPAFIERSADVHQAVKDILTSKTFDNGMICASEQAIIADRPIQEKVVDELKRQGAYFLNSEEADKVARQVMTPRGGMNAAMVGKTALQIAERSGIKVPVTTRILVARLEGYGPGHLLSYEKLTTVLGFYVVNDWHEACLLSIELLKLGGIGHSFSIHSRDEQIVKEFIQKPVFRILVNTPSAFGAIGYSTGLLPSLTLGCGTWGGSSISENLGPQHLINIKRLAYGTTKVDLAPASGSAQVFPKTSFEGTFRPEDIEGVVRQVLKEMRK
jgi:acetaldehyde dehydrogenase (acetylating)